MQEEQMQDESPEVIAPENPVEELQEENHPHEDPQEKNWKAARQRMDTQAKENRELKAQLELMQQQLEMIRQNSSKEDPEESEENYFTSSEKKLYSEIKQLKKALVEQDRRGEDIALERLRTKFPDFDAIVNTDSVKYLKENEAALAKAIYSLGGDSYEKGLAAYKIIKSSGWVPEGKDMEDKARMEQNSKKPMSVQAVRKQGALADANRFTNGLTPELKKALQQEMAEARKRA